MEQIKWPTSSIWFEETMEIFRQVDFGNEADEISKKVNSGEIFVDKKEASAKRVWGAIKARYFGQGEEKICFFDEVDINMHHYDSASKMSEAITNLERIIRYSLNRQYDVMLLSDHGYVAIEKKLGLQDKNISAEKKKSRYLILNKNEPVETMYYRDNISGADYLELGDKKLCFINSTNSLRETSRYNHGGISLQENVITALHFYGAPKEESNKLRIIFEALKAYNELTGKIRGATGYTCNVLSGTDVLHTVTIDVEEYNQIGRAHV
mgnify:CR=1 FL=1